MIRGSLFTQEFLIEGIAEYPEWHAMTPGKIQSIGNQLAAIFAKFPTGGSPIEATTEADLIEPILNTLDWDHFLTQQTTARKGREDVPDYLLFADEEAKSKANTEKSQWQRYRHGVAVLEAKAWNTQLDRKSSQPLDRVPSNQIIRYLTSVDTQSNGQIQWGILTNGRLWRIYYNRAKSKSEDYLEIDLPVALKLPGFQVDLFASGRVEDHDWLKVFYLLFRRASFLRERGLKTFHERALERGRYWESKVAEDLSDVVFDKVFPALLGALRNHDPKAPTVPNDTYLSELRDNALALLYRLLFVLFAEDRNLLPVYDGKYDDYGLRKRVREDIEQRIEQKDSFSAERDNYYHHTLNLFESIDKGDESIGLPPYNGGLFDTGRYALLRRVRIPDAVFAPLISNLSHRDVGGAMKWINYRDLSVQQLGSIYERLLEFYPTVDEGGEVSIRPNIFARKTSGSYYTPEPLVRLILERAVGPLLEERVAAFLKKIEDLRGFKDRKEKNKLLESVDPAAAMLELRICDPAMGSGHFLVSLVDYLADRILETIDAVETEGTVPWARKEAPYTSPVSTRIQSIRSRIIQQAADHKWNLKEEQLDDRQVVRRMILKRCVFGVDKNPMAVELAKVALWLHTFTVGAPLSFLDHHLRCGDSLFGEWVRSVQDEIKTRDAPLLPNAFIQSAKQAAKGMQLVEAATDADVTEVRRSAETFAGVASAVQPLDAFMQVFHALRWVVNDKDKLQREAIHLFLDNQFGDFVDIAAGRTALEPPSQAQMELALKAREDAASQGDLLRRNRPEKAELYPVFYDLFIKARSLIEEERFFNWEPAFPGVWDNWDSKVPSGGFDAVIGNPPWDRMKLQQVEWFAARKPEIAKAMRAADRKKLIERLEKAGDPLWRAYERASWHAETAAQRARKDGQYPLLSAGDTNLYSLFVERAHRLVKPSGLVGLLTPSGIAADKSASAFFKGIATEGRLAALFDFENKKVFFPDIDSRFKFCTYIAGGRKRMFDHTDMAFFLHATEEMSEPGRVFSLSHQDFARVNPNTGTAPIFRSQRDAEITRRIYEKFPILHDHAKGKVWPVKYFTMFHMTNDSGLFRTRAELEADGFYPVEGNRLKKGDETYVPLYVGRMIHHYDHRAASVDVNVENIHNAALSVDISVAQLQDPTFYTEPQFWVAEREIRAPVSYKFMLAFRDIARSTDARTFINTLIPRYACSNKLPILVSADDDWATYRALAPLLSANFASIIFDFVSRQKIQSTSMNWYIVEQLPVVPAGAFQAPLGKTTVANFVKEQVLHLTYTAWDMQPFAKDMGYDGDPFIWDEEDRRHRKAKLDALFFNLYGVGEDDAAYILSTFPIVQKHDEVEFGCYLTRDLILAYMRALKAGDTDVTVKLPGRLAS
jgi:hypothetical protein